MVSTSWDAKTLQFCNYFFFQCVSPSVVVCIDYYVTDYGGCVSMHLMSNSPAVASYFSATANKVSSDDGMLNIKLGIRNYVSRSDIKTSGQ